MTVRRIDGYDDPRFSVEVLRQHGAFETEDGVPCAVLVTGLRTATVDAPEEALDALIEECRFFAEHITVFEDAAGRVLRAFPEVPLFRVRLDDLQPSQFFVDEEKLAAVSTFVRVLEDVVIPVVPDGERWISCDGHTRLYAARLLGFEEVTAFLCEDPGDAIHDFARMARERGIRRPADLKRLSHADYAVRWNRFCDDYFASRSPSAGEREISP